MCRVVDCFDGVDTAGLVQVVKGSGLVGSWLCVKGLAALGPNEISALSTAMVNVLDEHRKVLAEEREVAPHRVPGMFMIGVGPEFDWRVQLPASLRESARMCTVTDCAHFISGDMQNSVLSPHTRSALGASGLSLSHASAYRTSNTSAVGTPDRRVICEIFMCAEGLEGWRAAAAELDRAMCMLQLGILNHERWCVGMRGVRAVVNKAIELSMIKSPATAFKNNIHAGASNWRTSIFRSGGAAISIEEHAQGLPAAEADANSNRGFGRGGGSREQAGKLKTDDANARKKEGGVPTGHESSARVAEAYMRVLQAALCEESYSYALIAARFAWSGVVPHIEKIEPAQDAEFTKKVSAIMSTRHMAQTPAFVGCCCMLNSGLHLNSHSQSRPAILAGPPHCGKSTCIDVVKRARIFDLNDPFKDPVPEASVKYITPLAFFASQKDDGEIFDAHSIRTSIEYARWYTSAELHDGFTYPSRWLVLDCTVIEELDVWVLHEHERKRKYGKNSVRNPSFIVETCSLDRAPPSLLSSALIVPFGVETVSWEVVFEGWRVGPGSLLESRTLKEIEALVYAHIPDMERFIAKECRSVVCVCVCVCVYYLSSCFMWAYDCVWD
jgi:hypothetical protein